MNTLHRIIVVFTLLLVCADAQADKRSFVGAGDTTAESVLVSFRMKIPTPDAMPVDARGIGLILSDSEHFAYDEAISFDEPNHNYAISIAFDIHNPQPTDLEPDEKGRVMGWFDGFGNWYDRPQREVSVHADGRERLNVLSPIEYRTGEWTDVLVQIDWIPGGANVMVRIGSTTIIDEPIWNVRPMKLRALLGTLGSGMEVEGLTILRLTELKEPIPEPISISVFDEALLTNAARLKSTIGFENVPEQIGRVIATLTLGEPEVGYDHWDKKGTIGISVPFDNSNTDFKVDTPERFEVFRFITPYRRGWTWYMDVTDLLPLFKDRREFDAHIGTYMKGWNVSFTLDFYPGVPDRTPIKVFKIWSGNAEIGNPDKPVAEFYQPIAFGVPEGATSARVRMTVTGHGMSPNSKNAGEFMPIWRTLTIRPEIPFDLDPEIQYVKSSARNQLWKTDVYLNPCRPQGGTWKFDRAGWAPGDKVEPWKVDTQPEFIFGQHIIIEYTLGEYINEGRGETWAPHHWTETVLIFYK